MSAVPANPGSIKACCWENAADEEAVWCPVCGSRLNRCLAFAECGGLLDDDGLCAKCVSPEAFVEKGARLGVKAGGALALPLVIVNPSARPLTIRNAWVRTDKERRPLAMDWSLLRPGSNAELGVSTGPLDMQGRVRIDVGFTAATAYQTGTGPREEPFAFVSSIYIDVEQGGGLVINQTINTAQGATNYMPVRVEGALDSGQGAALTERAYQAVRRADEYEREAAIRGYGDGALKGATVKRMAKFVWRGFAEGEAPESGPIDTRDGCLRLGRAAPRAQGGDGDVVLTIYGEDGKRDDVMSQAVSRLHLMMWIEAGRLFARAMSSKGMMLGDRAVPAETRVELSDGDVIDMLPKFPGALALRVRMTAEYGQVAQVTIERTPQSPTGSL